MLNKNILLSVVVITLLVLSAGVAWAGEETETDISGSAVEWQHRSAPLEGGASIEGILIKTPLAPGYCPSNGGSTTYEYISGVNYTKYPTGTMAITVEIFIANPTGCTHGDPCPEYDNSPEYVNAWIDWDGDGVWEAHERVIDVDLTGYHDLNYYGTMTTSVIVTIPPGSASTTWVRVNLGWDYDPDDPCELSWTWGDVFDERVSTETDLPQIEDIIVTGPPGDESSPMTTFPVTLEAIISSPAGFTVTSISWSGDGIPAGATGSPYTYTPATGTHGNKNVQCTITYVKTETGETGEDTMTKGYKLFFEKLGDEDGDSEPNWFEHWATDGAVPRLGEAHYDPTLGGYGCFGCIGTRVDISPIAAGQHYSSPIVLTTHFGTESFGGPTVTGIDCAAEVVAHEFYHKWAWENWQPGGAWVGESDSDDGLQAADCDDDLPDSYENTVSHTSNSDTDTYDLEHKKHSTYRRYGDQEYMAMKTGSATTGDPGKDWANPGKQTTPAYDISLISLPVSASYGPVQAKFTGTNNDEGIDTDGDGLYDYLRVSSEVSVANGGVFNIVAILRDSAGYDVTFINKLIVLDQGTQIITLDFDGVSIRKHDVDGIFDVNMLLSDEYGNELDHQYYHTSAYKPQEFQEQSAAFTGKFYEEVVDPDYDKLYNYLIVYAGVHVETPGTYTVRGWLHDPIKHEIVMAKGTTKLDEGVHYVSLNFDGSAIRQYRVDGPYSVMKLELMDRDNNRVDFINEAYTTDDYSYIQFQRRDAEFTDSYESWGKDPNKNEFYDYLTIAVGLNVVNPGRYTVIGDLCDTNGNKIGQTSAEKLFRAQGPASVELDFIGKDIFKNEKDGPYNLKEVLLIGEYGIVDQQQDAHETSKYNYKLFQPLVLLTDHYTDHGKDLDDDGLHDSLTVCAEVLVTDPGDCVMSARLVNQNGEEILWSDKRTYVDQNEPKTVCLSFDGKYLYASGIDGPYYVSDVYVYHTGDAWVPDYNGIAHQTAAYSYSEFEKSGIINGKVTKVNGDPVPNAPMIIGGVVQDYTNSDGNYRITILHDGTYTVKVDPSTSTGVTGDSAQISVKVGETVTHNFVLSPLMDSVKWRQPPDMKYGVNIQSTEREPIVADDWQCWDPRPVADVHFWGSYIGWEAHNPELVVAPPGVDRFIIRIYEDVPAYTNSDVPYSHPGELLYAKTVNMFEERYVDTIRHPDETHEHKFYYSLDLPEPFEQKEGTIYWISIAAVMPDDEYKYPWGWETSDTHWNDNACRNWYYNDYWEELTPETMPSWYREYYKTVDMAFELTVKPGPDLGDAPDATNSFPMSMTAYPGVQANFPTVYQAGSPPHGPIHHQPKALAFLGRRVTLEDEADIGLDDDGVNNLDPPNDAANLDRADDGVSMPLTLVHCEKNSFDYVVTVVNPLYRSVYVNVWFDWNRDGDWDDVMKCPDAAGTVPVAAPEWAVQNQQLQLSSPGEFTFTTPHFMAWRSLAGVVHDGAWMRITLSEQNWDPIAGVHGVGGSGPAGGYRYGETEDYYVEYSQPPPNTKWVQLPDLTQNGIDIKVDELRNIADDFECRSESLLTDVHFWGSWKDDKKGRIRNIRLSIHSDDPAGIGGSDKENEFSKPDKPLWERDFGPDEFRELLYHTVPDPGEWWWDPASREGAIPGGDTQVWRYDIRIKPEDAFLQRGTEDNPTIYWLYIVVETEKGEFGWKTRQLPDHFMDDAVWDYGSELPRFWKELRYPEGHPYHKLERNSIDMAFMLTFAELDWGDAPEGTVAPGYPTLLVSNGARHTIVPGFHLGRTIRISQESSPGLGDFDANVLGYVSPYRTSLSTAGYYQYGTPYGASFNGPAPPLTSNRSHLFLADTADGLSLFAVHDKPVDGCGGFASMHWTLAGDTAGVLVEDDPGETVTVTGGGTIFDSYHRWDPCCTDGMAFGSLDGVWTMIGAMTGNFTGMSEWHVHSSDNSSIALSFELNRRVRLDYQRPIDPEPDGQPDANALGDDNDGNDDENGVVFNTPLVSGQPATVTVTASTQGLLQGWIDFNADRDWTDPGEQIFVDQVLVSGPNILNFIVPATTASGATFARFRFSTVRGLSFEGPAPDGEVEDYKVTIGCKPGIDVEKTVFDPETGEWMDAITADVGDTVRFRFIIHNDGTCCDLTDMVVADVLSESLKYTDNATVNGVPGEPTFIGSISVAWEFPDLVLEPCQTITIEFDAEVVECGIDENIVTVKAVCADADVIVRDEDTATVMAGKPELEWTWNSTTIEPDYVQVMMAPVVADLNGDNIPDIIFSTFNRSWLAGGILRAISGDGSGEIFSVTDPDYRVQAGAEPAVADIDGDGKPEIMVSKNTSEVICFENDGTFKWISSATVGRLAIAVADLDQDGIPEIIAGRTVFNNDGTVRWTGASGSSYASTVADLDLNGKPEVVTGSTAYRYNGTIYWTSAYGGMPAIGNFDSDPYPEIVVVGGNNVSLKEHDGTLKWGPVAMPGGSGNGPPVVADIDGDGELEIGVGGRLHYVAFETNGSIKWMADIVDTSSRAAGSSAFDFDSDGSYEIVYSDHYYHRIFKGSDGTVLFETPGPSGTLIEQPIIADVDNDGHVEIVFAVNNYAFPGNTGIEVYGNDECWQAARPIWNQHTYHITNINDDATVPVVETNNWDVFNNYRVQSPHSCGEVNVTTVDITPPSQDVYSGPFTVNVTVNPVESITGVQFDLSFNTSLVGADSVIEGDLLSQDGASTFFSPGTIDNAAGTITGVAGAITTPGATVSSPGVFATIRMTAKSVEGTSSLDLSNVIVGDINGAPVSIMVNDGTVTITTCVGDVNDDGTVDVLDMIRVGQHWGETGTPGWIPEDVNRDGAINVLDMIMIGQHWGPCQEV